MKRRFLILTFFAATLVTFTSSGFWPLTQLRAHFGGKRTSLSIGSVLKRMQNPYYFFHRDLWEWESAPWEGKNVGFALYGKTWAWKPSAGLLTGVLFEPSLISPSSRDDYRAGLRFVLANRLHLDFDLGKGVSFFVRERAYFYQHDQPSTTFADDVYANPVMENQLTVGVQWPEASEGFQVRLPLHLQQRWYSDAQNARYSGALRSLAWFAPQLVVFLPQNSELTATYTTESLVASDSPRWTLAALTRGYLELSWRLPL